MDIQQHKRRLALWLAVLVTAFLTVSWFYYEHVTGRYAIKPMDTSGVQQTVQQVKNAWNNGNASSTNSGSQDLESLNSLLQ